VVDTTFDEGAPMYEFTLDFNALIDFVEGARIPNQQALYRVMEANEEVYMEYIRSSVWTDDQTDIFYEVERVFFSLRPP
jgi:hypothetical protein